MVYLLNTNLSNNQKVRIALQKIYGIGKNTSCQICDILGISNDIRLKRLTNLQIEKLIQLIHYNYPHGPDIKRSIQKNIQRLIKIASYRGFRHTEGLPVRGQRTHGNARTVRRIKKI